MNRCPAFALALLATLTVSHASFADEPAAAEVPMNDRTVVTVQARPTPPKPEKPETTWYGYQTLLVDAAVVPLGLLGSQVGDGKLGVAFMAVGYLGGGPAIHFAHGHLGTGFLSMGVRLAGLASGALIGAQLGAPEVDHPPAGSVSREQSTIYGGAIGAVVAIAVDAALLAHEPVVPAVRDPQSAFHVSPTVGVNPNGGASMGVVGTF